MQFYIELLNTDDKKVTCIFTASSPNNNISFYKTSYTFSNSQIPDYIYLQDHAYLIHFGVHPIL